MSFFEECLKKNVAEGYCSCPPHFEMPKTMRCSKCHKIYLHSLNKPILFMGRAEGTSAGNSVQLLAEKERKEKMCDKIHGVLSKIEFPLGQDEDAVSQAIHQLLFEGWKFVGVTKTHLSLMRKWEVDLSSNGINTKKY